MLAPLSHRCHFPTAQAESVSLHMHDRQAEAFGSERKDKGANTVVCMVYLSLPPSLACLFVHTSSSRWWLTSGVWTSSGATSMIWWTQVPEQHRAMCSMPNVRKHSLHCLFCSGKTRRKQKREARASMRKVMWLHAPWW